MFLNRENELVELKDGRKVWLSRACAVNALVFYKGSILLIKRSSTMPTAPNQWALPGGYLDWDESGQEAARREVYEETGLLLRDVDWYMPSDPCTIETRPKKDSLQNIILFYKFVPRPHLKQIPELDKFDTSEVSEVKWFPLQTVCENMSLAFNHKAAIIDTLSS